MNVELLQGLEKCETDIDSALRRFSGNEELYTTCLSAFLADQTMNELERSFKVQAWDEMFTAAHAIKGMAGNMGFIPLFHASAELVVLIRAGKTEELDASFLALKQCYQQLTSMLCRCGCMQTKGERI